MAKKRVQKKRPQAKKKSTALAVRQDTSLSLNNRSQVAVFAIELKKFISENKLSVRIGANDHVMVDGWKFALRSFGLVAITSKPLPRHEKGSYVTTLYAWREFETKAKPGKPSTKFKKSVPVFAGWLHDKAVIDEMRKREGKLLTDERTKPYFSYECDVEIRTINGNILVSRGTGLCSNIEFLKSAFDEYSICSMSETRAIGRGAKNLLGYVMKVAGFESTFAEEMQDESGNTIDIEHADGGDTDELTELETQEQIEMVYEKIKNKEWTVEYVQKQFKLNPEQLKAMTIMQNKVR